MREGRREEERERERENWGPQNLSLVSYFLQQGFTSLPVLTARDQAFKYRNLCRPLLL